MINANEVTEAFRDCLYNEDEIVDGEPIVEPVVGKGVIMDFGFHPERLEQKRQQVVEWLSQLPHQFRKDSEGGGWSFLNFCVTEDGDIWTGEHRTAEQLVALGGGLGLIRFQLPKMLWSSLPGGMPYLVIDI
jgi:hypothetical protein